MIGKEENFFEKESTTSDRCIHTPSAFAKQNLLYVQEVGRLQSLKPHRCIRENLDSYLFMIVLEGRGCLDIKNVHYELSQGNCAFIHCMEHYEHISDEQNGWKLAWVHFNGIAAKGYYELFKKHHDANVFGVQDIENWDALIGELLINQRKRNLYAELICGELLIQLANKVIDRVLDNEILEDEQTHALAEELREQLNQKYIAADVLQQVRDYYGKSTKELNDVFASHYGIKIEEYVSNRRFNAAKELLRFSIKSVEEVAQESGINDLIVMQQMFQEKEGVAAEEYRAKWAAWIR